MRSAFLCPKTLPLTVLLAAAFTFLCQFTVGEEIHKAAERGDVEKVAAILKNTPEKVQAKDEQGFTPLHHAAAQGRVEMVTLLVVYKAEVNAKSKDGSTPLHLSAQGARVTVVPPSEVANTLSEYKTILEQLIEAGAKVNEKDIFGKTPVAYASDRGFKDMSDVLSSHGGADWGSTMQEGLKAYRRGRYAEAEPLYKKALALAEKSFGPDHPAVGQCLNNLALLYDNLSRYAQVEPLYKRTLAILEKTVDPNHPVVAKTLNNLALLYDNQGRYEQAEPIYKRSLAIREKALGPDHPDVAQSLNN